MQDNCINKEEQRYAGYGCRSVDGRIEIYAKNVFMRLRGSR